MIPTTPDAFLKKYPVDPRIAQALLVQGEMCSKRSPLIAEIQDGEHQAAVEEALSNGANVNEVDGNGNTPLNLAVLRRNVALINLLLKNGANVDLVDGHGLSPLNIAVTRGQKDRLQTLFRANANVNIKNHTGQTPLHQAAEIPYEDVMKRMIKELLKKGADIEAQDNNGLTPLHMACTTLPFAPAIKVLVKAKANVNAQDKEGVTPLFRCAFKAHEMRVDNWELKGEIAGEPVEYHIERGQFSFTRDGKKEKIPARSIRHLCQSYCHEHFMYLDALEGVKALIKAGADVNLAANNGTSPVHILCLVGDVPTIKSLVKAKADFNTPGRFLVPPVSHVAQSGNLGALKIVLKTGIEIDAESEDGVTALHEAALRGYADVVKFLVKSGASQKTKSKVASGPYPKGATPSDVARIAGFFSIEGFLNKQ